MRELRLQGHSCIVNDSREEPDLADASATEDFFAVAAPEFVFLAAGRSGGIHANQKYPADLIRDNLLVECNVVHSAFRFGVRKLLYLASSCVYPRECGQPMRTGSLLTGPFEPTNEAYAMAKMAGITLCRAYRKQHGADFISGIPANIFGPGDDFDPEDSHVIPALIGKMHHAKLQRLPSVELWGTGTPRREFLFSDDLANACVFLMNAYDRPGPINIGDGTDLSIRDLAGMVGVAVGYPGTIRFDPSKPDGMPRKALDASEILALGWRAKTPLEDALRATYEGFLASRAESGTKGRPRRTTPEGTRENG